MDRISFETLAEQVNVNGYAVLEDFFRPQECDEMKETAYDLVDELRMNEEKITIFSTQKEQQLDEDYFLGSSDKVRNFYEDAAIGEDGKLTVEPRLAINKIGHALHALVPLFRFYTYCNRVKAVARLLGLQEPAVVQSMVIFKNPKVGGDVKPHQDATFLYSEPKPVIGFWIALEDATVENGCLQVVSGSHKSGVHRRLVRNPDPNGKEKVIYNGPSPIYPASRFKPIPVRKGSCIILHGHVVHKSTVNVSSNPRPAYTFHIVETKNNTISPENWLREGPGARFENLYLVEPIVTSTTDADADESKTNESKQTNVTNEAEISTVSC